MMGCSPKAVGFLKLSVPHVALVLFYFSYLFMGSLVFHFLERTPEQEELEIVQFHGKDETIRLEIMAMILNCSETAADEEILDDLLLKLVDTVTHPDWKGGRQDVVESGNEWTISSSLAFCFTTITTIGYGVVVPVTVLGKVTVILYSAIGVPLSFLLFADMGELLARLASKTASSIRKRCRGKNLKKFKELGDTDSNDSTAVYRDHHAVYRDPSGGGDIVGDNSDGISLEEGSTLSGSKRQSRIILQKQPSYLASVLEEDNSGDVPCVVVVFLLLTYMCIGALSFSLSEGWSYPDAFYFTFITLTTIGFGDLYPVKHIENNSLFPCMIYTLVGLCCLSMCITLLQARFIKLVTSIKFKARSITRYHGGDTTDGPGSPR